MTRPPALEMPGSVAGAARLALVALVLVTLACASGPALTRDQVLEEMDVVGELDSRLDRANQDGLELLAPQGVASARQLLEESIAAAQADDTDEAVQRATEGIERLDQAAADSRQTSEALREVLESRERAVAADAPTLLPDRFASLEARLRDAALKAESGDLEGAKAARPRLMDGYSALELEALKTDATELARMAIATAREAEADRHAPKTFERARKELDIATGILETDRSRVAQANVHARRASEFAAQSQHISELVKEFDRQDYDHEDTVLWYQEQVADIAAPLEGEVSFTEPNHEVIGNVRSQVASLVAAHADAELQLTAARERIAALELASTMSTEELQVQLASVERAQRESEARYARVDALFTDKEAVVSRRGQDVLLETYGFTFPVGESEIRSENFPLLTKISKAIAEFENPEVIVAGHTDGTGSTEVNQKLSEDRAAKVGDFLVQVAGLPADRVVTRGFGESQPLATNETAEGRALNRRIEILIVNHPGDTYQTPLGAVSAPPREE
ncbi:MAG: OmpA family protein [Myxococcota bacterium]